MIDEPLWERVLARRQRASLRGAKVSAALAGAGHTGRGGPKYAFSGLLRCGLCGSSMVVVGGTNLWRAYGCSGNKNGGDAVCTNAMSVQQGIVESRLLVPIKTKLLTREKLEALRRRVAHRAAAAPKATDNGPRINELRRQIENLTEAMATGVLRASPALAGRLTAAEAELGRLTAEASKAASRIIDFPARLMARFKQAIDRLETYFTRDPHRARAALREVCGEIPLFPHESGKFLVAKLGLSETLLRAAVGTNEKFVVAGVGFEPTTFGL